MKSGFDLGGSLAVGLLCGLLIGVFLYGISYANTKIEADRARGRARKAAAKAKQLRIVADEEAALKPLKPPPVTVFGGKPSKQYVFLEVKPRPSKDR